jgi:hypothetical protein
VYFHWETLRSIIGKSAKAMGHFLPRPWRAKEGQDRRVTVLVETAVLVEILVVLVLAVRLLFMASHLFGWEWIGWTAAAAALAGILVWGRKRLRTRRRFSVLPLVHGKTRRRITWRNALLAAAVMLAILIVCLLAISGWRPPMYYLLLALVILLCCWAAFCVTADAMKGRPLREMRALAALLGLKAFLLWSQWGIVIGFDGGPHFQMVDAFAKAKMIPHMALDQMFYAYHPPLAFVLAALAKLFLTDTARSVQVVSSLMSLVMFLFLRGTLRRLELLRRVEAVVFLYIAAAIPLQVYLAHSVNMDVVVVAAMAAVMYFSVALFWTKRSPYRWAHILFLAVALCAAVLTKFSGIIAFGIPVAAALLTPFTGTRRVSVLRALGIVALAAALVSPYYYTRYYATQGKLFPSNADFFQREEQDQSREARDADRPGFLWKMITASGAPSGNPQYRDMDAARLVETWRDAWRQDLWLGPQDAVRRLVSALYLLFMPLLCIVGGVLFFCWRDAPPLWRRLGFLLLIIFCANAAALVKYTYDFPWPGAVLMKGIYVASSTWFLAFCLAHLTRLRTVLDLRWAKFWQALLSVLLLLFVLLNHVLPIY